MEPPGVLVVGETPSLGRSIVELLESGGVRARYVGDVRASVPLAGRSAGFPVVIAACNEAYCATARQWAAGALSDATLVVVGARDPLLVRSPQLHLVPLPLLPAQFLSMVHGLLGTFDSPDSSGNDR